MPVWLRSILKSIFIPGGVMLGIAAFLVRVPWVPLSLPGITYFYYAVFVAALALSLRFRTWRIVFCSVILLLTHHALIMATHGRLAGTGAGRIAFEVLASLVPLDFLLLSFLPERTLNRSSLVGIATVLFFESSFIAVFSRPDQPQLSWFHLSIVHSYPFRLPQPAFI